MFDPAAIDAYYANKIAALQDTIHQLEGTIHIKDAEIQRLRRMVAAAGKMGFRDDKDYRLVEVRCQITKEVIFDAKDPREVFLIAMNDMLDELKHWVEEQKPKHPATILAEALANIKHPAKIFADALVNNNHP